MLANMYKFLRRNSTKLIVTGFAISGALVLFKFMKNSLLQEEFYKLQILNQYRSKSILESKLNYSKKTVAKLLIPLRKIIYSMINLEEMIQLTSSINTKEKLSHWQDIKILSFTRLFLSMYSYCILLAMVEVDVDSVMQAQLTELESTNLHAGSPNFQNIYFFFNKGIILLSQMIESSVTNNVGSISLKEKFQRDDILKLIFKIRNEIDIQKLKFENSSRLKYQLEYNAASNQYERNDFGNLFDSHVNNYFQKLNFLLDEHFSVKPNVDFSSDFDIKPSINLNSNFNVKPIGNLSSDFTVKPKISLDSDFNDKPFVNVNSDFNVQPNGTFNLECNVKPVVKPNYALNDDSGRGVIVPMAKLIPIISNVTDHLFETGFAWTSPTF